jgi:hypothetical protein
VGGSNSATRLPACGATVIPRRDGIIEKIEAAAVRRTPQARELRDIFSGYGQKRGRAGPPHAGQHPTMIALRVALLLRRNTAESLFAQLKHRGIGGRGSEVPRWISTDRQMAWFVGGCVLAVIAPTPGSRDRRL